MHIAPFDVVRADGPGNPAGFPQMFWLVGARLGVVLISIPKCGCTVQKRWLLASQYGQSLEEVDGDVHQRAIEELSLLHSDADRIQRRLADSQVVAFVRDPWIRLASAFRDKFLSPVLTVSSVAAIEGAAALRGMRLSRDAVASCPDHGADKLLAVCRRVDYKRGISFSEFIDYVCRTQDAHLDTHWRSQTWFVRQLPRSAISVCPLTEISATLRDFGGPFVPPLSRTVQDLDSGGQSLADVPAGKLRDNGRVPTAGSLYTPELVERVAARFQEDVKLYRSVSETDSYQVLRHGWGDHATGTYFKATRTCE